MRNYATKPTILLLICTLILTMAPVLYAQATDDLPVITILANSNGAGVNALNDSRTQQAMFEAIGVRPYYE